MFVSNKKREKILVTGSSGFIGSNLIKKIKKLDPICLINKNKVGIKNVKKINLNLNDKKKIKEIFKKINADIIFHFAALTNPRRNEKNKIYSRKLNYNFNKSLVNLIQKRKTHLIFLSTDKVYNGKIKNPDEKINTTPTGIYARFKRQSELLFIKNIKKIHILRLPIVHGFGISSNSFIDFAIKKIKNKKKVYLANNVFRCFVDIDQLVFFLKQLIKDKNYGIYNVGSNCMSYFDRVKQLCIAKNLDYEKYLFSEKITAKPYRQELNTKKLKSVFHFNFD